MAKPDIFRGQFPENPDLNNQKLAIAQAKFLQFQNDPDSIVAEATEGMLTTGNEWLAVTINSLVEKYAASDGISTANRLHQGIAFAFSYFRDVLKTVTHEPIPTITPEIARKVGLAGKQMKRQRMVDSEFYVGEDYTKVRKERDFGELEKMDISLLYVTFGVLSQLEAQQATEEDRKAFFGGVRIMNYLFSQIALEQVTPN